jgi:hypothetical protein
MADNPNTGASPAPEDPEKERLRKEKKAEKDAAKAAKVAKALAKQEKEKAAKEQKEKAAKEQQETATPSEVRKRVAWGLHCIPSGNWSTSLKILRSPTFNSDACSLTGS